MAPAKMAAPSLWTNSIESPRLDLPRKRHNGSFKSSIKSVNRLGELNKTGVCLTVRYGVLLSCRAPHAKQQFHAHI